MVQKPKVSVITTCKKGNPNLSRLKEALAAQTYKNFEFIVTHNQTIPQGWNAGIKKAKGDILAFTESDAVPSKNWLKELVPLVKKKVAVRGLTSVYEGGLDMSNFLIMRDDCLHFNTALQITEDTDWFARLKKNGIKIKKVPKGAVVHYQERNIAKLIHWIFWGHYYRIKIIKDHGLFSEERIWRITASSIYHALISIVGLAGIVVGLVRWYLFGWIRSK